MWSVHFLTRWLRYTILLHKNWPRESSGPEGGPEGPKFRPRGGPKGSKFRSRRAQRARRARRPQIQTEGPGAPIWARTHSPQRLRAPGGRPEFKPIFRPKVWPPEFGPRFATSQVVGSWARSTIRRAGSTQTQIHVFERLPNYKKILEYTGNMWGS